VPSRLEATTYTCPKCKADFETAYVDGVFQVVWVEEKSSNEPSATAITDPLAREILGVSVTADFVAIKTAWRKVAQQY